MINVKTKCEYCVKEDVCGIKEDFKDIHLLTQNTNIGGYLLDADVRFNFDLSCKYYSLKIKTPRNFGRSINEIIGRD